MKLEHIPPGYEAYRAEFPNLALCRIATQEKGLYQIISEAGTQSAQVSGKFRHELLIPQLYSRAK